MKLYYSFDFRNISRITRERVCDEINKVEESEKTPERTEENVSLSFGL